MELALKAYPWPEGVAIPRLMPAQEFPFNGDYHLAAEVLRLKQLYALTCAIETGTCLGSTTAWLGDHFTWVASFEIEQRYFDIACQRLDDMGSVEVFRVDSVVGMRMQQQRMNSMERPLYWLDAHWGDQCPLLDELAVIAERPSLSCILIHDFQVPGTDFGYDSMPDGRPFNMELVKPYLDRIYGEGKWRHISV